MVRGFWAIVRVLGRIEYILFLCLLALIFTILFVRMAGAMTIQSVKSPGGIEAWLVQEKSVPLVALRFALQGGSAQDPVGKEGLANFLTSMMDEGAGELNAQAFQEREEEIAMRMSFEDARDHFYGNFETLTANRREAVELLRLALTQPRFDQDAIERMRQQLKASIEFAARDPSRVASDAWYALAFPGHPYGRSPRGSLKSVESISRDDLVGYHRAIFAKSNLKVVAVGDISADELGKLLDHAFGGLPDAPDLKSVSDRAPAHGSQKIIDMAVPQSVAVFGAGSLKRKDPDFIAAFVLNHIVGGGGFSAKLMEEVREKRGLAYSVYSYLNPLDHSSIMMGTVATKNEAISESLDVIRTELGRIAKEGPTQEDLDNAKQYLTGSYPLRFDANRKIANQLLGIMVEDLGADYIVNRNKFIEAVTLDDVKRVAKRLLDPGNLVVTIVGQPMNMDKPAKASAGGRSPG